MGVVQALPMDLQRWLSLDATQTDRQTERQTDIETNTALISPFSLGGSPGVAHGSPEMALSGCQADRQTDRQKDRQKDRHRDEYGIDFSFLT